MQFWQGAFAELGCRRQLEEGGGVGTLGSDSQEPRPARDPSNNRGGPQLRGQRRPGVERGGAGVARLRHQTCRRPRGRQQQAGSAARGRAQGMFDVACVGLRTTQRYLAGRLRVGGARRAV